VAIRRQGEQWVVEFQQAGIRVFRRLPAAATKAQAQELETKLRREIIDQVTLGHTPELTLEKAVDLWLHDTLSRKKDQRMPAANAEYLRPFLAGRSVQEAADAARDARQRWMSSASCTKRGDPARSPLSAATVNRRLAVLKAALRYAYKQGWADQNYGQRIEMLPEPPHRETFLTREQVTKLARAMPSPDGRAALLLLSFTGLRVGELLRLSTSDIGADSLTVRESKNGKPRIVPVPSPAQPLLRCLPLSLSYSQLQWAFRSARTAAGLPQVRLHDLRHTTASWLLQKGVDLFTIGKILGNPTAVQRYAHHDDKSLKRAMQKLR
jgi:integrase